MKQQFDAYKPEDFEVWKTLFERQVINLEDKACAEYLKALDDMSEVLRPDQIARFSELNDWFNSRTGWQIECVPGLIPVDEFFALLAKKRFCSSTWLRSMDQLDYLEEPDMFHDIFGHVPLLSNPIFSEFAHEYGKLGNKLKNAEEKVIMLQRLYWFTIEFGLIEQNGLKIYGAGIASSFGESIACLKDDVPKLAFDLEEVIHTFFRTDEIQSKYFVISSFEELFDAVIKLTENWNYGKVVYY